MSRSITINVRTGRNCKISGYTVNYHRLKTGNKTETDWEKSVDLMATSTKELHAHIDTALEDLNAVKKRGG